MRRFGWLAVILSILIGLAVVLRRSNQEGEGGTALRPPQVPGSPGSKNPTSEEARSSAPKSPRTIEVPRGIGNFRITVRSLGKPLGGARFEMREINGPGEQFFETKEDGIREIHEIPVAAYLVTVKLTKHVPQNHTVDIRPNQATDLNVDLKAGAQISGMVVDEGGRPLPGTFVNLLNPESKLFVNSELNTRTDAGGNYLMDGVPVEELSIHFRHPQFKPLEKTGIRPREAGDFLEIHAILHAGARLSGRVLNGEGRPIAGARVLGITGYSTSAQTDDAGAFTLHGLEEQNAMIKVYARGFGTRTLWSVRPDSPPLEIRVGTAGSIRVRLVSDPPLEACRLVVRRYETDLGREIESQPEVTEKDDGSHLLADLEPGTYRVVVDAPGYETSDQVSVTVVAGHEVDAGTLLLKKQVK